MSDVFVHMNYIPRDSDDARPNGNLITANCHEESPAKRQKIAIACDPCRTRKVRCNGARPGTLIVVAEIPGLSLYSSVDFCSLPDVHEEKSQGYPM
jgi:hypothetical protein